MDWSSLIYLAAIVIFWAIVFFVALFMTRRALHGVGELPVDDAVAHTPVSANGHIPAADQASTQKPVAASNNGSEKKR
jgi:hypothetical protein